MPLLSKTRRRCALTSDCKIDQVDFPDWIFFLTSNLMEEITPNPDALNATKAFNSFMTGPYHIETSPLIALQIKGLVSMR